MSGQTKEAFSDPQASLRLPSPDGSQNWPPCADPAAFLRTSAGAVSGGRKGGAGHVDRPLGMPGQRHEARFYHSCLFKKHGGYPGTLHRALERGFSVLHVCRPL